MATALTSIYMMDSSPILHPALKDINMLNDLPRLPLDQPVPTGVLSRRRHAISSGCDSPYRSRPRMKRRGAISYDNSDACAMYIRYLGEALAQKQRTGDQSFWPELLANETKLLSLERKRSQKSSVHEECRYSSRSLKVPAEATHSTSILECVGVEKPAAIQNVLANVEIWDFDMFAFNRVTEGCPLVHIGLHVFQKHKIFEHFKLDSMKVHKFLTSIESNYHEENAYHNSVHAADVTQAIHCLIMDPLIYSSLTPVEVFASLLAAMCHDLDHPGVNQNYLVNTSSHLATIHGTNSLLERHHCHTAKAILGESKLLNHLPDPERLEIISLMEDFILSTDFSKHKHFMGQFEEMLVSQKPIDLRSQVERHFILMMAIKAADVSNPTRALHLSRRWSEKIMEEFFLQGDAERRLKLPISFLCDRETITVAKAQSDFFGFVALPLFKAWSQLVRSPLSVQMCKNIVKNKEYWDGILSSSSDSD